ncbi:MAG: LAGLIDADG family homing endonuclease [Candidatus Aenigmarchaeota archaeon]|nr:LAGLIDADG family homing endonuclease [Candidatus Aenigmarchaeota archaeon]
MKTRINKLSLQGFKSFRRRVSVPFFPGFNVFCGPNGVGKCLLGSILVPLPNGESKSIRELVENALSKSKNVNKIDDGFYTYENPDNIKILTLDSSFKLRPKKVKAFVKRSAPNKLLKILTRSGREIIVTPYHPLFSINDGKIKSLKAEELQKDVKVATPRKLPVYGQRNKIDLINLFSKEDDVYVPFSLELKKEVEKLLNEFPSYKDFCKSVGISYHTIKGLLDGQSIKYYSLAKILQANGYSREKIEGFLKNIKHKKTNKTIRIPVELNEDLARFLGYLISEGLSSINNQLRFTNEDQSLINDICNLSNSLFQTKTHVYSYKGSTKDLIIYSKPGQIFLERVFGIKVGSDCRSKNIPSIIFKSDKNIIAHFLAGLFDGDGYLHLSFHKNKTRCYFRYSTANSRLAKDVFDLLLRLNLQPIIRKKDKYASNTKKRKKKEYYSIFVFGVKQTKKLCELIPFKSLNKRRIKEEIKTINVKYNPNLDLIPGINKLIKKIVREARVSVKANKRLCPKLQAYYENKCECSRNGLLEVLSFIEEKGKITEKTRKKIEYLRNLAKSDIYWDEIVEIEEIKPKKEWVYDLCVDETHNFVAEDLIVHNSNILDAISFVLGSASTKALRAGRLHELIYHGNGDIPPSDYASVTLWLENSDKLFPFEVPEVAIKRIINKKGMSIFKINGRTTTREKVIELLSSAQIYPDGYNIIMQGDVSQVIEMNPQERRGVIDEVSGIAYYNEKKEKAQKNLEKVGEKLKEVEIILTERLERLQELETDRNTALRYNELREKLQTLEASLAYKRFQIEQEKYSKVEEEIKECEADILRVEDNIRNIDKTIEMKEKRKKEITEIILIRSKEARIREEIEEVKNKILRNEDKIESIQREIERIDKTIERLRTLQERKPVLFKRGVKAILDLKIADVFGTISELIKVPKEYQAAIEVAGGSRLQNLIVKDTKTATDCIEYLKREKIGRATFLPLNRIKPRKLNPEQKSLLKKPGVVGLITNIINFDRKYSPAIEYVFGDTIIVENLGVARQLGIGKVRMVTLDGDLVERSGAMIGGYYKKEEVTGGFDFGIEEYENNKKELEEEINFLRIEIGQLNRKLDELRASKESESKEVLDLESEKIKIDEELAKIALIRKELYEKRLELQTQVNRLKISNAKKEAELNNLKLEMEKYKVIEYIDGKPAVLELQIQQTISTLNSLGLVNMKAIEEYDAFKGEFEELKHKYDQIKKERDAIVDMIEKVEGKRKEVFYECLRVIDKNFREIFREIADGEASLELENPLDIESGLLIQANPAGKSLLNIDAMSGGEKALTALAFLFAIQKYKPAPFYVLDEVDAYLDKVNTKRVVEMIKKLSEKEQFIIITHNDYTIKQGDRVYGISMENGESKILGLELPEM